MSSLSLCYVIAVYFFIILCFGGENNRIHAAIIFLASILNVIFELPESIDMAEYIYNRKVFILWDGATALVLSMFLMFDKTAWKQAILLVFATLCHIMIIYDLTIASSVFSLFFYSFYDELIITIGILQLAVSHDSFYTALRRLQGAIFRGARNNRCYSASGTTPKKSGCRT